MLRSDEIRKPGFTWCAVTKEHHKSDHWDRIDYIFAGRATPSSSISLIDFRVTKAVTIGENADEAEEVITPWPSDHRAVLAELRLRRKLDAL